MLWAYELRLLIYSLILSHQLSFHCNDMVNSDGNSMKPNKLDDAKINDIKWTRKFQSCYTLFYDFVIQMINESTWLFTAQLNVRLLHIFRFTIDSSRHERHSTLQNIFKQLRRLKLNSHIIISNHRFICLSR